jgi:uncharacterized protein
MFSTIPEFPALADLDRTHKPALDGLLAQLQPQTSELTFTNLFTWRHAYGARITRIGEVVCLFSLRADPDDSFLLPPLGPDAAAEHVRTGLQFLAAEDHDAKLARIGETDLQRLGITGDQFEITEDRNNWDYVYRVQDLIELPEDRYPEKRRHIERFTKRFRFDYRRITPDLVPACQELQDLWCDEKHCDLYSSLRAEHRAVNEVLENLEALRVVGGAILVNDRVQAFTLGEALNDNTVVCHIEKASPDLHGAFQVINQQFLIHEWSDWEFMNREQDLGEPGLRKAKESYLPAKMIEKWTVRLRP